MNVTKTDIVEEEVTIPKIDLSKVLFQKRNHPDLQKKSKPHVSNNPAYEMEIDLHIEELVDTHSGMSNAEIIQIQLKHFQNALDKAISEHCRKLVVIHGVGNGRLKSEVQAILSSHKNLRFHDGSYAKYVYGATEIVIG
ncbi:MAG: Smr/MutS family protein [Bacteroidia bacterium]